MPNQPLPLIDIDCFFEAGELASQGQFKGVDIPVIFRQAYLNVEVDIIGMDNAAPIALVKAGDVAGVVQGDVITIESTEYTITNVKPNSESYTMLFLEAAP